MKPKSDEKKLLDIIDELRHQLYSTKSELKKIKNWYMSKLEELQYDTGRINDELKNITISIDDEIDEQCDYINETLDDLEINDTYITIRDKEYHENE